MSSAINSKVQTNNEFNQALSQQKGSALDKDAFMLLLVTQFKYQDPLNPAEDKEFIAQLAQFSSLEQLMNLNTSMEGLTTATTQGQLINATSYIGKMVDATGNSISKTTTDKDKNEFSISTFRYAIGEPAVSGSINVYDADRNLVYVQEMPAQNAGTYTFEWEGKDSRGNVVPDGIYSIAPVFTNAEGKSITDYDAVVDGKVSGVTTVSGTTYLTLEDGRNVALAEVRRVSETKTATVNKNGEVSLSKTTPDKDKNEYVMSTFRYTLDEDSAGGTFKVYDSAKKLVNTLNIPAQSAGSYPFQWDGKDSDGKVVADGTYSGKLSLTNADGKLIACEAVVNGSVKITGEAGTGGETGTETAKAA